MTGTRCSPNQTPHDAPVTNRFVAEVTIIDRAHPFFGQRLPVVYRNCPGRRDHVLVELPGGSRRAVPVAATSLADHIAGLGDRTVPPLAQVSVRTLVPLAHLVRALKRRAMEVPDAAGHRSSTSTASLTTGEDDPD